MVRTLVVIATAYCLHGTTATGHRTHSGTVAVDPSVIALGSRLRVQGYGEGVADDTGSAIRGSRVDVWFSSCRRAYAWGSRVVAVWVRR